MKYIIDITETYKYAVEIGRIKNGSIASKVILNAVKDGVPYEERPHGEWIDYQDAKYSYLANCKNCGYQMNTHEEHGYFNFCPNCGADMRKKESARNDG